jgi:hypothetical protein
MKYMRQTARYTRADCERNRETAKELNTTPVLGKNTGNTVEVVGNIYT